MGHEVQIPWPAFLEPLVPDAALVDSAELTLRELSAARVSHECLPAGSAPSPSTGLAPVVGSLMGPRSVVSPAQTARAREQPVSLMDLDFWAEPPVAPDSASVPHNDALHHLSVREAGTEGQVPELPICSANYNIPTPKSTLPVGDSSTPQNLLPGPQVPPAAPGVSSGSLPLPDGDRSEHASTASGMSELRKCELATLQATKLRQIAQLKLAAARQIAQRRTG